MRITCPHCGERDRREFTYQGADEIMAHDHKLRYNLFSPEVDPVWRDVGKVVGEDAAEKMRHMLLSNAW